MGLPRRRASRRWNGISKTAANNRAVAKQTGITRTAVTAKVVRCELVRGFTIRVLIRATIGMWIR
ncbi:hypothetical protein L3i22_038430 [Actinoplanes sp. L3-i22]|nr:hypothetical protein L3i22_038430 [Actinoplanes sp. L3-i22]